MTKDEMFELLFWDDKKWNAWRQEADNNREILDLTGITIPTTTVLHNADLRRVDLSGCTADGVKFIGCDFHRANLSNGRFDGASFDQSMLFKVNAQDATFVGASFARVSLDSAQLQRSNFSRANLNQSDLSYVDATGANFSGASMRGAIIQKAKFYDATIDAAIIRQASLWVTAEGVAAILPQTLEQLAQEVRRQILPETDRLLRDCQVLTEPNGAKQTGDETVSAATGERTFETRGRITSVSTDLTGRKFVNVIALCLDTGGVLREHAFELPFSVFPAKELATGQTFDLHIVLHEPAARR